MYEWYKPRFYASFNASDNAYYFTGNGLYENAVTEGDGIFSLKGVDARVTVEHEELPGGAVRQRTTVRNTGGSPLSVEVLSSSFTAGIGTEGSRPWKKHRFVIHYAESCWCGEAQWRHVYAEDAGLYRTYNHGSQSSFRLCSQSSWSTCRFEPVVMIEDTELGETYFAGIGAGSGWCINVGIRGYRDDIGLCIMVSDCSEKNDGWHADLLPGESVTTCYSVVGRVKGGFEKAAGALTHAHRAICSVPFDGAVPPLCFNDYMNCLWALPTREKTMPLARRAAEIGCEYYVMDAGWYGKNKNDEYDLGMWDIDDDLFGEGGLKGLFDDIKKLGMKPGIWFEFESAGIDSPVVREHPDYILRRRGHPVGGRRVMLDFRVPGVREHIRERVKALYAIGVRFIKNDYNANTGVGTDPDGAGSVREHAAAFYAFIDSLRRDFPDLIIENCGSGAMRSDIGTLSHFHLQSVSDQEDYFRLPSIVSGSAACYPPERCGVWAYPYPTKIDFRTTFSPSPEFTDRFSDGKITSYCCVTGLMGLFYLSGRIDAADGFNMKLMKDASALYKKYRRGTMSSVPVYPTGTFDIDTDGLDTFGLNDAPSRTLRLAVWNNSDESRSAVIGLSKYITGGSVVDRFPCIAGYSSSLEGTDLNITLPRGKSALFVVIEY